MKTEEQRQAARVSAKLYYENNWEAVRERQKDYYYKNREKILAKAVEKYWEGLLDESNDERVEICC
jgi:hypothetical protein